MDAMIVGFNEIQKTLEPAFGGKNVKIILDGENAFISVEKTTTKTLKARGCFNNCANPQMALNEKGAWERAAVEKYAAYNNS